jgi:hypothetical protein
MPAPQHGRNLLRRRVCPRVLSLKPRFACVYLSAVLRVSEPHRMASTHLPPNVHPLEPGADAHCGFLLRQAPTRLDRWLGLRVTLK